MTGFRPYAVMRLMMPVVLLLAAAMPTGAGAQAPQAVAAQTGSEFDAMIGDAKAMMLVDPAKTIAKAKQAETLAAALDPARRVAGRATAEWLQGEAYLRINDVDHAEPLIEAALTALKAQGKATKLMGDVLLSSGGLHTATAQVASALADYQQAHQIFTQAGETRSRAIALLSIAGLYLDAKDYNNALKYYAQALDVYQGDPALLISIYNNRAATLKELKRFDEAEVQYRKALALAGTMKSVVLQAQILRNVARVQLDANHVAQAEATIRAAWKLSDPQDIAGNAQLSAVAAQAALQGGRLEQAAALISRTFAGVNLTQTTLAFRNAHETAFEVFRKLGRNDAALEHLEALKRLDDQTTSLATSNNSALMTARFDFANQETRIAKLKADELQRKVDTERAQARTRQTIAIGIAVVVVIILGMLSFGIVTLRRSRNQVRAANIDLAATNSALGKALAAKTEFLATTSHEIRTPLNGILGMTQVMLADRTLNDQVRDRIGVVHGAGVTMRALVDDILDVAKMETGNLTIEQVPLDLKATLGDVTRMWEEQAKGRGLGFTLDLGDSPAWIAGDAARLRQIVFNLLSNALKFTEAGGVTLRALAVDGRLRIAVTDTGIGIPADKYEVIFESFRQVDAGTTRKFGGTGLGLAICRNLARAMDGEVLVESVEDAGSTFTLDLPLILADAPEAAPVVEASRALLILDRSPITRSMLRAVLEPRAGAVQFAGTIDEAVEKLRAGQIDQVLIDDATIKALEDRDSGLSAVAAAAMETGARTSLLWAAPDESDHPGLLATGIGQIIAKPIAGAALIEKLFVSYNLSGEQLVSRAA